MIDTIYVERELAVHPRALAVCARFPHARRIPCDRYGEVFNRKAQDFRLQKARPALILAAKHGQTVLPAPPAYGIGGSRNFYFSHMLNCLYDCRYCFLQGMYRSAHYVLFVNYEDFAEAVVAHAADAAPGEPAYFFSGYDCDSLALEPVSGFVRFMLPVFERHPNAWLELRTKSTQIRLLLERPPLANCIVAYTLTPAPLAAAVEHRAPETAARLRALERLGAHGWPLGLRLDPLLHSPRYRDHYRQLMEAITSRLRPEWIHSVSVGVFRMPQTYFRNLERLYPADPLIASAFTNTRGLTGYDDALSAEMVDFCTGELRRFLPAEKIFPCTGHP